MTRRHLEGRSKWYEPYDGKSDRIPAIEFCQAHRSAKQFDFLGIQPAFSLFPGDDSHT